MTARDDYPELDELDAFEPYVSSATMFAAQAALDAIDHLRKVNEVLANQVLDLLDERKAAWASGYNAAVAERARQRNQAEKANGTPVDSPAELSDAGGQR